MKAKEAPEKIYLQKNTTTDCYDEFWPEWFEARAKDSDIEYTRTDAFIEKALAYLNSKFYFHNAFYGVVSTDFNVMEELFENFVKYMKGENNV